MDALDQQERPPMATGQSLHCSLRTSLEVKESRPEVGSSKNSTHGLVMSAMPMLTRLHCSTPARPSRNPCQSS